MKCTDCSAGIKPVVAVDIDGTLGQYHAHFLCFADAYLGDVAGPMSYAGREPFREWFCREWQVDSRTWGDIKLAYRQGAQKRSMPAYPGVADLTRRITELGAELWMTTTRPHLRLDNVDPDTRFWLEKQGVRYQYMLYDEDKYEQLANLVDRERVVAVLDDLPEQVQAAARLFGPGAVIMRSTRWNWEWTWEQKAGTLLEAAVLIEYKINEWRAKHE